MYSNINVMKERDFAEMMATELGVPVSELVQGYAQFLTDSIEML